MKKLIGVEVGATFDMLKVLGVGVTNKWGHPTSRCVCDCGNTVEVASSPLRRGKIKSCGCRKLIGSFPLRTPPPINQRFGKLIVLAEVARRQVGGSSKRDLKCVCDCGNVKNVLLCQIKNKSVKSCGCGRRVGSRPFKKSPRGKKYGKLTIVGEGIRRGTEAKRTERCICVCGKIKDILVSSLRGGISRSCGCSIGSKSEQEIVDFITEILPSNTPVKTRDRTILDKQEIDLYIPAHAFALEFNGLHWHSEHIDMGSKGIKLGKDKNYHLNKTLQCAKKGIFLLHVWEDEWLFRQDQIKTKIRNLLHLSSQGVMARKTKVVGVNKEDASAFYEINHVQGKCASTRDLGLMDPQNELVAVMSFKVHKDQTTWELVRFASSKNVVGGFSKLLKFFQKNNEWTKIISFADRSWSKGDLYEKTGWVLDGILAPDYKYVVGNRRVHKFNYRHSGGGMKSKLEHYCALLTERENMLGNGIYRIWDCGKLRYVLTKD